MDIPRLCSKIIIFSFHLLFFLVPLVLCPLNFELFEYNKMMLTYAFSIIIGLAWGLKMVAEKRFSLARTPLDLPLFLFLGSQMASTLFSTDPHTSIFGYYSRFHGGLLSTVSYILLYYALVSNFGAGVTVTRPVSSKGHGYVEKKLVLSLLKTALFSAALVAIYGILEHPNPLFRDAAGNWHGIDYQYWLQEVELRVFSTIGQPNWLAAYLGMLIPLAIALMLTTPPVGTSEKPRVLGPKLFYLILAVLFYWCLLFTNSRAGAAGFSIGLLTFLILLFFKYSTLGSTIVVPKVDKGKKQTQEGGFGKINLAFLTILLLIYGLLTLVSGKFLISRFGGILPEGIIVDRQRDQQLSGINQKKAPSPLSLSPSGQAVSIIPPSETAKIRNIVWQGALEIFKHYPLFGSGVETFAYSYYQFRPPEHNLTTEWDFLYNKAHNEYLNFLATTGFVGLFTYLLIITIFGWWFLRYYRRTNQGTTPVLVLGLFSAYVGYLVQNISGFSVVSVATFFFLFPAFCFLSTTKLPVSSFSLNRGSFFRRLASIIVTLAAGLGLCTLTRMWLADTQFAKANKLAEAGYFDSSYLYATKAITLNHQEPLYYDQLAYDAAVLATLEKEATSAALLAQEAVLASQKALTTSPLNPNFWKTAIKVLYQLGKLNPEFYQKALEATKVAIELSPTEPKLPYNLGLVYLQLEQPEKSIESFQKAIDLKPDLRDPHYALAVVYHQQAIADNQVPDRKLMEKAISELDHILTFIDAGDVEAQEKLRVWQEEL